MQKYVFKIQEQYKFNTGLRWLDTLECENAVYETHERAREAAAKYMQVWLDNCEECCNNLITGQWDTIELPVLRIVPIEVL